MSETPSDTCSLEELYRVEDLKDISKCFAKLHANIGAESCQFREKLKETTDRVVELEKAMSHFENEQLEMKESTMPEIIEEAEKHNNSINSRRNSCPESLGKEMEPNCSWYYRGNKRNFRSVKT